MDYSGPIFCRGCKHLKTYTSMNMPSVFWYYCDLEHCELENKKGDKDESIRSEARSDD